MQITIVAVGTLRIGDPIWDIYEFYRSRLKKLSWVVDIVEIRPIATSVDMLEQEAVAIGNAIQGHEYLIVLDEHGSGFSSQELADQVEALKVQSRHPIAIVVGGAYGIADSIKAKANLSLSFGRTTWPHKLARVMLLEQLYRVFQILAGHPYHHA